jgi:hypothetical protein
VYGAVIFEMRNVNKDSLKKNILAFWFVLINYIIIKFLFMGIWNFYKLNRKITCAWVWNISQRLFKVSNWDIEWMKNTLKFIRTFYL